jgi:mRNA interferase HigB
MKIHLIRKETIEAFCRKNAPARIAFEEWHAKIKYAGWETPADIQSTFPSSDLLGKGTNRVVFDIGGNKYRLIAKYAFGDQQVHLFICWIGTHNHYNKLCYKGKQYTVSGY